MSSSHVTLSAAADDRKARLAKLKSLKRKQPDAADDDVPVGPRPTSSTPIDEVRATSPRPAAPEDEVDVARLHLSGRNFDFETRGPKLGFEAPPTLGLEKQTLEDQAEELEAELRRKAAEEAKDDKGIDLFKLQPKKPNWDLKRELDKKMEVLNVRTDNAIARLVRERLEAKKAAVIKDAGPSAAAENGDAAEAGGLAGAELLEGIRLREQEDEEEARREREQELEED
ncbi:hypothetical protein NKR23_g7763 [Pleurostoma richardsiae]|jgi:coiled-coil domain-containing protein 12|uniref:Uncharacterized protein n=1 Tax=Pleurostoma richardsiae TaxID=41990 RepID=A0AA38RKV1_9PEZI|nr:hypothetical protein NKR23_g7763 [Pleurostoma richardsiae]